MATAETEAGDADHVEVRVLTVSYAKVCVYQWRQLLGHCIGIPFHVIIFRMLFDMFPDMLILPALYGVLIGIIILHMLLCIAILLDVRFLHLLLKSRHVEDLHWAIGKRGDAMLQSAGMAYRVFRTELPRFVTGRWKWLMRKVSERPSHPGNHGKKGNGGKRPRKSD